MKYCHMYILFSYLNKSSLHKKVVENAFTYWKLFLFPNKEHLQYLEKDLILLNVLSQPKNDKVSKYNNFILENTTQLEGMQWIKKHRNDE